MYYMELTKHFTLLRDISPTVDDYLTRELFEEDYYDEEEGELAYNYSAKDVLGACYSIIIDELNAIGIHFAIDLDTLTQDIYTCGYVYLIRKFVDKPYLAKLLQATDTVDAVSKYIDTDERKPNLLEDVVNIVNIKSHDYELTEMEYILPQTYTDESFTTYLKSVIAAINTPDAIIVKDLTAVENYTKHIATLRQLAYRYTYAVIGMLNLEPQLDMTKIAKLLRDYDRDKIQPDTIALYSLIDKENVPTSLYATKKKYMDIHHANSPHHVEYWLADNPLKQKFTLDNLILLVVHHVEPGTSPEEFRSEVEDTVSKLHDILSIQHKQLARKMVDAIQPLMAKDPVVQESE